MSRISTKAVGTAQEGHAGLRPYSHVLVVGESLTDLIRTPSGIREHPGGSPANVALGLGRLGVKTTFLTALGADARGEAIEQRLRAAGVRVLPASWSLAATSTALADIQEDGAARYTFDITWRLPDLIELPAVNHVHVGSLGAFLEPGGGRVEQIVRELGTNATVSIDPNIRPDLLGERQAVTTRFERLARLADVVKLSDEDAAFLYPDADPREAVQRIARLGPRVVALTAGAQGSLLVSGTHMGEIGPVPSSVADTVGAGDSYMAALLWKLLAGRRSRLEPANNVELIDAGRFAAEAAAITVSRPGAEPPTLEELHFGDDAPPIGHPRSTRTAFSADADSALPSAAPAPSPAHTNLATARSLGLQALEARGELE